MSLKQDHRRPVPEWLARLDPAALETSPFPLNDVLRNSLYYPAAGTDGRPVQFLGGFIHSFVYVDYGHNEEDLVDELRDRGFAGYHVVGRKRLTERDLAPTGWSPKIPERYRSEIETFSSRKTSGFVRTPFATWYVFDRDLDKDESHGPPRFSLVYICADGVAAYQALYWRAHTAPEVLVIIQPGYGFGGNYTDFRDPGGFFAWTVLYGNGPHIPGFMVCGMYRDFRQENSFWPDVFSEHVERFQHEMGNGVWKRRGYIIS